MNLELYTAYDRNTMVGEFGDAIAQLDAITPVSEAAEGSREFRASLSADGYNLVALYYGTDQPTAGSPDHYVLEPLG